MEEKSVPWWRKAIHFALDGIRSGFGLFSRTPQKNETPEPARPAGQQNSLKEESELIDHSPTLNPEIAPEIETLAEVQAATSASVATPSAQAPSQVVREFEPDVEAVPEPATQAAAEILPVIETEPVPEAHSPQIETEAEAEAADKDEAAISMSAAEQEPEQNKNIEERHRPAIHSSEEPAVGVKSAPEPTR